jgi:hypothetical protein
MANPQRPQSSTDLGLKAALQDLAEILNATPLEVFRKKDFQVARRQIRDLMLEAGHATRSRRDRLTELQSLLRSCASLERDVACLNAELETFRRQAKRDVYQRYDIGSVIVRGYYTATLHNLSDAFHFSVQVDHGMGLFSERRLVLMHAVPLPKRAPSDTSANDCARRWFDDHPTFLIQTVGDPVDDLWNAHVRPFTTDGFSVWEDDDSLAKHLVQEGHASSY